MDNEFVKRYKDQRDRLKKQFEAEKVGEQSLFTTQTKLFKPLIETQKETARAIQDKIYAGQETTNNTLIPFLKELQKRNDHLETLQTLPYYPAEIEGISQSTPIKAQRIINVDIDGELVNTTHRENLQDMGLDLPSEVQKNENYNETFKKIKSKNSEIGQYLGTSSKRSEKEKEIYRSQKETLKLYKEKIRGLIEAKQFIIKSGEGLRHRLVKPKRGRGRPRMYPDVIVYNNPNELVIKLHDFAAARKAGNTGVDNYINSILDELLRIKAIDKDLYDNCFHKIFPSI